MADIMGTDNTETLAKLAIAGRSITGHAEQFFRDVSPLLSELETTLIEEGYADILLCDGLMLSKVGGDGEFKFHTVRSIAEFHYCVDELLPDEFKTEGKFRQTLMSVQGVLHLLEQGWFDKVRAQPPSFWSRER
jgi:hypothetical protein